MPGPNFPAYFETPSRRVLALATAVAAGALVVGACSGPSHNSMENTTPTTGSINLLQGEWGYMPGDQVTGNGLIIEGRDFKIVEQNGSGGQPNPPVNEYGTHLAMNGGFAVDAQLDQIKGPASLRLYASPPEVTDEFRVEPKSFGVTVDGHKIMVNVWDGKGTNNLAKQAPAVTRSYDFSGGDAAVDLRLTDKSGQVQVEANGQVVGAVPDDGTFQSGEAWFGLSADTPNGGFRVNKLTANGINGGNISAVNTAAAPALPKTPDGLQELANHTRPGFLIGADLATWAATSSDSYDKMIFGGNFGIVTPENAMKWQFTEPEPGVYDFHEADAIVAMAEKNHLQVHGHNLVFGEALPAWVRDMPTSTPEQKAAVQKVLYDHVYTIVNHFKGGVPEWDINEPFAYYDNNGNIPSNPLNDNVFYRAMGEDYIKVVCQAAMAADPNVKLWVNDYGAENDTGAYWQSVYSSLKKWKVDWKLPIYGFGFQSHIYDPSSDDISNAYDDNGNPILNDHFNQLAAIGLKSRVSELDAPLQDPGYASDQSSQAAQFAGVLKLCLQNKNCVAFSMWSLGMTDIYQDNGALQQAIDSPWGPNNLPTGSALRAMQKVLQTTH